MTPTPGIASAAEIEHWRSEFPIVSTCTYLVSHSLGAMPRKTNAYLQEFADAWSTRGVRAWHEGWWEAGRETGNILAPILGVARNTISMHQNVTVAQGIIGSCFTYDGTRRKIVMSDLEFPSNHYLFEGFRRYGAEIVYVPSPDPIRLDLQRFLDAIDERTVLVPLSLVLFKSACITDAQAVIEKAHRVGAHVILDVYQGAGTVPMDLAGWGADFAVGGSVKWLCGGPGAGYIYAHPNLVDRLEPRFAGWFSHARPFGFEAPPIDYAEGIGRFVGGTPNMPAYYQAREGYKIIREVGVGAIRENARRQSQLLMDGALERGYVVNTPREFEKRGNHVTVDVPNAQAVKEELIRRGFVIDYRPGAGIRIAPHFYNTDDECVAILDEIDAILKTLA